MGKWPNLDVCIGFFRAGSVFYKKGVLVYLVFVYLEAFSAFNGLDSLSEDRKGE